MDYDKFIHFIHQSPYSLFAATYFVAIFDGAIEMKVKEGGEMIEPIPLNRDLRILFR